MCKRVSIVAVILAMIGASSCPPSRLRVTQACSKPGRSYAEELVALKALEHLTRVLRQTLAREANYRKSNQSNEGNLVRGREGDRDEREIVMSGRS